MISVSVYKMVAITNLDEVEKLIKESGKREVEVNFEDWPTEDKLQRTITQTLRADFAINDIVKMPYIVATANTERNKWKRNWRDAQGELLPKNARIISYHTSLLFFVCESMVYVAFSTLNENIFNAIRKDIFVDNWGEIERAKKFEIQNDLLYWLVYRKMKYSGLVQNNGIYLTNISYYAGSAIEQTHKIKSTGERVCDLLGTMAHIFQDELFDSLGVTVVINKATYSFILYLTGDVKIDEVDCSGNLADDVDEDFLLVRLCLSIYTQIIPTLISVYEQHKENSKWNSRIKEDFSKENGMMLLKRIIPQLGLPAHTTVGDILERIEFVSDVAATNE